MSDHDFEPVCLICVRKINNDNPSSSKSSCGGGDEKLFRRLLIFAERRLKLGESITSAFLSAADYQSCDLRPSPMVMKKNNVYFDKTNQDNQDLSPVEPQIFCAECSEIVRNLCQLHNDISKIERLVQSKLEELAEKFQELDKQQRKGQGRSASLRSKSTDLEVKLKQKLSQQIEELRLDKGHNSQSQVRKSRRREVEVARLRDLLVRHVQEHLQEMEDPLPDPETITSATLQGRTRRDYPDLNPDPQQSSEVTAVPEETLEPPCYNQIQPEAEDSSMIEITLMSTMVNDDDDDDVYHDDEHDNDVKPDISEYEDVPPATSSPISKKAKKPRGGVSEDEDWEPSALFQAPSRKPPSPRPEKKRRHLDNEEKNTLEGDGEPEPPPPKKSKRKPSTDEERKSSVVTCGRCESAFPRGELLMTHMKKVHEKKMRQHLERSGEVHKFLKFHCPFCPACYFLEESLQVHLEYLKNYHDRRFGTEFRFQCDGSNGEGCSLEDGLQCVTLRDLSDHLERDHVGATIFECSKCPWSFLHKNSRDFHETLHAHGKRGSGAAQMSQCPAPGCPLTFAQLHQLQRHFSESHADNLRPFECSKCPISKKFPSMHDLLSHQKFVHEQAALLASIEGDGDFICEMCPNTFKTRVMLHRHQTKCRSKNRCDICKERFDDFRQLTQHLTSEHFPEGRFVCPEEGCGRKFQLRAGFRKHVKRHNKSELLCPHCPKTYDNPNSYDNHLKIAHSLETMGEERQRTNICQDCGAAYYTGRELREHMTAKHRTEETQVHQCPLCEKTFNVENWMKTHIRRKHKMDWRDVPGLTAKRIEIKKVQNN